MRTPDFSKGLLPAIVQDVQTGKVLMLAYMNEESFSRTVNEKRVTFFSRSKNRLWTKGETSGHFLDVNEVLVDCDNDTILIKAKPHGPTCHTGDSSCFGPENTSPDFLAHLEAIIRNRKENPSDKSYTSSLFSQGINKIAQKVGEEAVELVIESKDDHEDLFLGEAADLLFHYLVLLQAKGYSLEHVLGILRERHR